MTKKTVQRRHDSEPDLVWQIPPDRGTDQLSYAKCNAMVVANEPDILLDTATMVSKLGLNVFATYAAGDALFHFKSNEISLLLTDFDMPVINGFQFGHSIKMRFPSTKVIIMTGLGRAEVAGWIKHGIIDAWLFKPFTLSELKSTVINIGLPHNAGIEYQPPI